MSLVKKPDEGINFYEEHTQGIKLNAHLNGVMTLTKANTTWRKFCDQMARVFPVHNDPTIYLYPPDEMDNMMIPD